MGDKHACPEIQGLILTNKMRTKETASVRTSDKLNCPLTHFSHLRKRPDIIHSSWGHFGKLWTGFKGAGTEICIPFILLTAFYVCLGLGIGHVR